MAMAITTAASSTARVSTASAEQTASDDFQKMKKRLINLFTMFGGESFKSFPVSLVLAYHDMRGMISWFGEQVEKNRISLKLEEQFTKNTFYNRGSPEEPEFLHAFGKGPVLQCAHLTVINDCTRFVEVDLTQENDRVKLILKVAKTYHKTPPLPKPVFYDRTTQLVQLYEDDSAPIVDIRTEAERLQQQLQHPQLLIVARCFSTVQMSFDGTISKMQIPEKISPENFDRNPPRAGDPISQQKTGSSSDNLIQVRELRFSP